MLPTVSQQLICLLTMQTDTNCLQEPARKRQKASSRGRSLSELLPAPKNAPAAGGRRLEVLGGGGSGAAASGAGGGRGSGRRYDSDDDDDIVPGTEDRSGMVELRPGGAGGMRGWHGARGPSGAFLSLFPAPRPPHVHPLTHGMHLITAWSV
jgi:hypothetical protein